MVTLQKLENSVKFTFTESSHYLFNGEIEVPLNSLALIIDKSDMVTFKKANSNDIFISANISEFGMSKAALEQWYMENMVDSGISEEEVEEAINTALSYYYDMDEVDDLIENFYDNVEYNSTNSRINFKHGTVVKGYLDATPFIVDGMVSNVEILNGYLVITFNVDSGKQPIQIPLTDIFNPSNYYTKTDVNGLLANKQDTLVSGTNIKTINNESILGSGNIALNVTVDSALDSGSTNPVENRAIYNKFDEVEEVTAQALNAINEALDGKADTATTYTKTDVDGLLANKQNTLVSGTNIKTINNESILGEGNIEIQGGGGKAIEAGRGISITTGETADTVSFNLPISAGTGANSIVMGEKATANGAWSFANGNGDILYGTSAGGERAIAIGYVCNANGECSIANGQYCTANGIYSHAIGSYVNSYNDFETSIGKYNVSSSSNNTLFSVGNGASISARHNAFEIRQNGDIYCSDGTNDVKLQDTIAATAANTTALGGLKLVKLTQAEYDALATKDNSALYVIVN